MKNTYRNMSLNILKNPNTSRIIFLIAFRISTFIFLLLICGLDQAKAENCYFTEKDTFKQMRTFTYNGNSVEVPADSGDTEIYKSTFSSYYRQISVACKTMQKSGIKVNPSISSQPSSGTEFTFINHPNFYWKLKFENYHYFPTINSTENNFNFNTLDSVFDFSNRFTLSIYKRGGNATDAFTVPAGLLGTWASTDGFKVAEIVLSSPINISTTTCETNNINVDMKDYNLSELQSTSNGTKNISFNLNLTKCPNSIKNVKYSLKATTEAINTEQGIVSLNNSSTAKGIALQVKDSEGVPLKLDSYHQFTGSKNGDTFSIPLNASYVKLPNKELKAGTANTEVTFLIQYL